MSEIYIEAINTQEIEDTLETLQKRADDTKGLTAELANHLRNVIEESFEKEQTPDAKEWSPIQPRKSDAHPEKILYDKGNMQDRLYADNDANSVTVGTNATKKGYPYPIVMQFGNKEGTTPARAFMPIKLNGELYSQTLKELEQIVEKYFEFLGK